MKIAAWPDKAERKLCSYWLKYLLLLVYNRSVPMTFSLAVHGYQRGGVLDQRGADLVVRDGHAAVRGAAPHLRSVRWNPGDLSPCQHTGLGQDQAQQQHSLTAKAGDLEPGLFDCHLDQNGYYLLSIGRLRH